MSGSSSFDELEVLRYLDGLPNGTPAGYGEPSPMTRALVAEQLVEIDMKLSGGNVYWRGRISEAGRARVRAAHR